MKKIITILTAEKMFQHLLTGVFYLVEIRGIGSPDTGDLIPLSDSSMGILNLLYFLLFTMGLIGLLKGRRKSLRFILFLALLDIVLEFIFHGLFFITISVVVSTILVLLISRYLKLERQT